MDLWSGNPQKAPGLQSGINMYSEHKLKLMDSKCADWEEFTVCTNVLGACRVKTNKGHSWDLGSDWYLDVPEL